MHTEATTPWPLSYRSTITCEHKIEHDGTFIYMQSSKGCEKLTQDNAATIGKNVIATCIIQFAKYVPCEGGFDITCVTCSDPAGSIPDMIKNKLAKRHADGPLNLAIFMLTGNGPTD